jgi:hypothetical protein
MRRPVVALDLVIDICQDQVFRALGYHNGNRRPVRVERRLGELWPAAIALITPRACYRLVGRESAAATGMPGLSDLVAVGVCTIGPALEEESQRLSTAGEVFDALLLDAIGSTAAEATADALNAELCTVARTHNRAACARVSPGYDGWDTARQADLLALLPTGEIGVSLTSGLMMVPRKSVSLAVAFVSTRAAASDDSTGCQRCGHAECRHRRVPVPADASASTD